MALEDDIIKAINTNLTAEVSGRLKVRIQQAEDNERKLALVEKELKEVKEALQSAKALISTEEQLNEKIRKFAETRDAAKEATVAKAIVDLKLEFAQQRVHDMKELVKDVFANSRFKYTVTEGGSVPVPNNTPGGYPIAMPTSRTVAVEGTGPAPEIGKGG